MHCLKTKKPKCSAILSSRASHSELFLDLMEKMCQELQVDSKRTFRDKLLKNLDKQALVSSALLKG